MLELERVKKNQVDEEDSLPKKRSRRTRGAGGTAVTTLLALTTAGCGSSIAPTPSEAYTPAPIETAGQSAFPSVNTEPAATSSSSEGAVIFSSPTPDALPTPNFLEVEPSNKQLIPRLKDVAGKAGMYIGEEMTGYGQSNPDWLNIFESQFNFATIDWGLGWGDSEPSQGNFDFSIADRQVRLAQEYGMKIRGQALVFPSNLPQWLSNRNFSKSQLTKILENHITTVMKHFKGEIKEWVVVNEPYIYPYRQNDIFYKTIGPNYIDLAFKTARQADPSATLIYNDSANESSNSNNPNGLTTALTRETVQRLKKEGLVDMVGVQMHLDASNPPSKQDVINTIKSYGLPVAITEFDIDLQNVAGTEKQRYALQAQIATNMVGACRQSGVCKEFTLWGIDDAYSMYAMNRGEKNSAATPFDANLQPKPEYFAIRKAL